MAPGTDKTGHANHGIWGGPEIVRPLTGAGVNQARSSGPLPWKPWDTVPLPPEEIMLELTVLAVPDCPNEPVLLERLASVMADNPGAAVTRTVIADEAAAARHGMHGSPTLLVNGTDPFAVPGTPAGLSCRLYRDKDGPADGAPSVAALREALAATAAAPAGPGEVGRN
jgi:hypothetical protein